MSDDFESGRRWHDMGGQPAGPIERGEHDFALWEKRVDALVILCGNKGLFSVDGLRRALEDLGADAFEKLGYYDRWMAACVENLVERDVFTLAELNARMEEVASRGATYGEAQGHGE